MDEAKREEIEQLLAQGLDYYGEDDVANAILTWERVLAIDPENAEANDYIKAADRRSKPRPKRSSGTPGAAHMRLVLEDVRRMLADGHVREAYEALSGGERREGKLDLAWEATLDLARSRRYAEVRGRLGSLASVPRLAANDADLRTFNLPPNAGFLLSMIDGATPMADLISVSGMDAFDVLHTLEGLVAAGLVEVVK